MSFCWGHRALVHGCFLEGTRQHFLRPFQVTQLTLTERCGRTCPPPRTPAPHYGIGPEEGSACGAWVKGDVAEPGPSCLEPHLLTSGLAPWYLYTPPFPGQDSRGSEVGDKSWRPQEAHFGVEWGDGPQYCDYLEVTVILSMPWCLGPSTGLYFLKELNALQFHTSAFLP